jgi:hypothetical protein
LAESVASLVQVVPQHADPAAQIGPLDGHLHVPLSHAAPVAQTTPQPPQLFVSRLVGEHWPLQHVRPPSHAGEQASGPVPELVLPAPEPVPPLPAR